MEPDVIVRGRESHEEGEKEKKIDAIEHTLFIIIIIHSLYIYTIRFIYRLQTGMDQLVVTVKIPKQTHNTQNRQHCCCLQLIPIPIEKNNSACDSDHRVHRG